MAKTKAQPRPYTMRRLGILNPMGEIWSCKTFDTEEEARRYIKNFWSGTDNELLDKYGVVPVNVTVTVVT